MAKSAGIQVEGARQLRATMKRAELDLGDLKGAHAEAAGVVTPVARARAPKRSGRLASSGRGAGTKTMALVRFGGASVPYANPIHWGWRDHGIEANPFAAEAAHATETVWTAIYTRAVDRVLDRIKGV